ncbi:lysosomal protective protein-like [Ptychodera flava]|uniref:lysosomal protective protein-like n=1 Tax=Ptychodera flava TaxID=63121 RepID=UPI003969DCD5
MVTNKLSPGILSFVVFCVIFMIFVEADNPDEIKSLPGLSKQPTFKQYSGYLNATGSKRLHYWFVESQNSPKDDPVVLLLNGGPGCSSLDGFLSELGPFHVNDDGKTLYVNEYSWNKVANVLFLEAPAGVGFSYSDDKNYTTSDDETSLNNYVALQSFFKKFPEFANNSFYITGESYGGIYVPTLSVRVMEGNATINLKGFAIGNGLLSWELNDNSLVYFSYYHGIFGDDLWADLNNYCCSKGVCNFHDNTDPNCRIAMDQVNHIINDIGLNRYALYMDCAGGIPPHATRYLRDMKNVFRFYKFDPPKLRPTKKVNVTGLPTVNSGKNGLKSVPPCLNASAATSYLNIPDVRKALHIPENLPSWEMCSDEVGNNYQIIYRSMYDQFKTLLTQYRGMVYNGDTDMACNFLGDQWFVESLKLNETQKRQQWIYNNQVAGFYHKFDRLTYVTVKGAGHMVPQWKPGQSLLMFENFLNGTM